MIVEVIRGLFGSKKLAPAEGISHEDIQETFQATNKQNGILFLREALFAIM